MTALSIAEKISQLEREAARSWRGWAADLAAGRPSPGPRDVLDAAALLQIDEPAGALEGDAAALLEAARLDAEAVAVEAEFTAVLKPYGGRPGLERKIAAARATLSELLAVDIGWDWACPARCRDQARAVRAAHPRVFTVSEGSIDG